MYINRYLQKSSRSFFLFGARGTGKTTWVEKNYPDAHKISLLNESYYQKFLADPQLFRNELRSLKLSTWVFVDEIQRLPNLLNEVHAAIEECKLKFILCGSSSRKLKEAGVNLLAGRAVQRRLFPFLPQEILETFHLNHSMIFGTLPICAFAENEKEKKEILESYAQLYLKEEIQSEGIVRNLPAFSRFLPVAALCHAQTLNVSNIARDAKASRSTVDGYIQILKDTLMAFEIYGFESKLRIKERKLPKLYWIDNGIVCAILKRWHTPEGEFKGALFEGLVANMLNIYKHYYDNFCNDIYYWSPSESNSTEVDFLLERRSSEQLGGEFEYVAIEVKSASNFRNDFSKGLRAISSLKNLRRKIVVMPEVTRMITKEGIEVMNFKEFALQLETIWDG
jgi:uncharacterized protein